MKKRLLSLALALALCLGLAVPSMAADVSGLDAKSAAAYAQVLSAQIGESGIRTKESEPGIVYAGLVDMDGDGTPELLVFDALEACLDVGIWSIKNGAAVQTGSYGTSNYIYDGKIAFARKNGQTALFIDGEWVHSSMFYRVYGRDLCYIGKDGPINDYSVMYGDDIENENEEFPPMKDLSSISYDKSWTVDSTPLLTCNYYWETGKENTVKALQEALTAKVNAPSTSTTASGSYGPYIIRGGEGGWPWSVTFSEAKVEKKTIQYRDMWDVEGKKAYNPYESRSVTLVTVKSGSSISIQIDGEGGGGVQHSLIQDGNGKYTYCVGATMLYGDDFNMAWLSSDGEEMKNELKTGALMISTRAWDNSEAYIIEMESSSSKPSTPSTPSKPSTPSFTDVPSWEYYAEPVKWAIAQGITNGTTNTTFSPEETCTQAQILTFLHRAVGKPAPVGTVSFPVDAAYSDAVRWAADMGIIDRTSFNPSQFCTRGTAMNYIWHAMDDPYTQLALQFTDVSRTSPYIAAVSWAVRNGITDGTSPTTFSPNDTCTRGQIVTFLYRTMTR